MGTAGSNEVGRPARLRRSVVGLLCAAAGIPALVVPGVALAQETKPVALEEVIVTARKREENIQEVPISMQALSGDRLAQDGVNSLSDVEFSVPGLSIGSQGSAFDGNRIGIRGVSSIRGYTGDQAAVAVHFDGVYLPQSGQAIGHMYDIARVEVLKGPQGSLYGRNAVSGVINVVSQAPDKEFGGRAQVSVGSRNLVQAEAVLNAPVNDDHGFRFSAISINQDGYVENILGGDKIGKQEYASGRIRYGGHFGDSVTVDASLQYGSDKSDEARQPARLDMETSQFTRPNGTVGTVSVLTQGIHFYETAIDVPYDYDRKDTNFSLQIDVDLGGSNLRFITGYSKFENNVDGDAIQALTPTPEGAFIGTQSSKGVSQEIDWFSTSKSRVDWRIGAYYMQEKVNETRFNDDTTSVFQTPFSVTGYDDFRLWQDGDAYALFGSLDFHATDQLTFSVGARYNHETKEQYQGETWGVMTPEGEVPNCHDVVGALFCYSEDQQKYTWTGPSGDLSVNWQVTDANLVYLRAARGFRSGAVGGVIGLDNGIDQLFYGPALFTLTKLGEEKLDSYELGSKNTLLDGRLLLNGAIFYQVYKDQLAFTVDPITFRFIEGNLGKTDYKGVELGLDWQMTDIWSFDLAAMYNDGEIKEVGDIVIGAKPGNKPIVSPKTSAAAGLNARFPLAGGTLTARVDYNYRGKVYFQLNNADFEDSVGLTNASLRYESQGRKWFAFLVGRNLTDEEYVAFRAMPAANQPGPGVARPGEPRTWEFGIGVNF